MVVSNSGIVKIAPKWGKTLPFGTWGETLGFIEQDSLALISELSFGHCGTSVEVAGQF